MGIYHPLSFPISCKRNRFNCFTAPKANNRNRSGNARDILIDKDYVRPERINNFKQFFYRLETGETWYFITRMSRTSRQINRSSSVSSSNSTLFAGFEGLGCRANSLKTNLYVNVESSLHKNNYQLENQPTSAFTATIAFLIGATPISLRRKNISV